MLRFSRLAVLALAGLAASPGLAQTDCSGAEPYVFVLLDSSGSMNHAPLCSLEDLSLGNCTELCPTGDCWLPLDGDDPRSKWYLAKQALYQALEGAPGLRFGFGTYNTDELRVREKHWSYRADTAGPTIPNWGPFPAVGDREVFGAVWACSSAVTDGGVGCTAANPADLSDAWERERMLQWPKAGRLFTTASTFFVRHAGVLYQVRYQPLFGGTLPVASVSVTVRLERCLTPTCSTRTLLASQVVSYSQPLEFVSWGLSVKRTEPAKDYFPSSVATHAVATNTCSGVEGNDDSPADSYLGYNLHRPTVTDPRGTHLSLGDRIPLDWEADHRVDVQQRLAPNLVLGESTPHFGTARYLRNAPNPGESLLRLQFESARPIVAVGSTPLGGALHSFRTWYGGNGVDPGWRALAEALDPDWLCRSVQLVLITDGDDSCAGDPCTEAAELYFQHGVETHVVHFGAALEPGSKLPCIAYNGGTGAPIEATHGPALDWALAELFASFTTP